jgi:hypothetical protein
MHHVDIGGIGSHVDKDMHAHMAPSWQYLDDAVVATGSVLRCVRLDNGPNEDYAAALKNLKFAASHVSTRILLLNPHFKT